jgi:hypothetical protein
MSGIHDAVLEYTRNALEAALITNIAEDDVARAGVISIGPLQDEPTPDTARISATLHENDPDRLISGAVTGMSDDWSDEVEEIEIGGAVTHIRRFTLKARCLLVNTREDLNAARNIASTVRERCEVALFSLPFLNVLSGSEYVSRGILSDEFGGEMLQAGGPEAYDYHIKVRFSVLTTRTGVIP